MLPSVNVVAPEVISDSDLDATMSTTVEVVDPFSCASCHAEAAAAQRTAPTTSLSESSDDSRSVGAPKMSLKRSSLLDRYLSLYVERPGSCFAGCFCTILLLTVASLASGCMNLTLDQKTSWFVHTGDSTRILKAVLLSKEEAMQGGRRLDAAEAEDQTPLSLREDVEAFPGASGPIWWSQTGPSARWLGEDEATEKWLPEGFPVTEPKEAEHADDRRLQEQGTYAGRRLVIYFQAAPDGTVFSPEHLRDICHFERVLISDPLCSRRESKATDTALAEAADYCYESRQTVTRIFYTNFSYANFSETECPLLEQSYVDRLVATIRDDVALNGAVSQYAQMLHPVFETELRSPVVRSTFYVPFLKVGKVQIDELDKELVFGKMFQQFDPPLTYGFLRSAFEADEDRSAKFGSLRVRVHYNVSEVPQMIPSDFAMAFFSVVFVWLAIWANLGSLFMATFGMFQIICSLPVAAIIYRKIMQVDYFEYLHILVVYLALGVGADDVFVLVHAWGRLRNNVDRFPDGDVHEVLKATWLRTFSAVFNTSLTTAVAFLSMSISKLMPMRTCGWYAALCIFVNYVFVITFTPATLMFYTARLEGTKGCRGLWARCRGGSLLQKAMVQYYLPCMAHSVQVGGRTVRPFSLAAVVVMAGVGIQGGYFALQLTPPTEPEQWFPSKHMWTDLSTFVLDNSFTPGHNMFARVDFVFGIKDMDFADFDVYKPDESNGKVMYDPSFDLSTAEAQQGLLDFCRWVRTLECHLPGCHNRGDGSLLLAQGEDPGISCFLEDMQRWLLNTTASSQLPTGQAFLTAVTEFRTQPLGDWNDSPTNIATMEGDYLRTIGVIGGELKFAMVSIRSQLPNYEAFGTGNDVRRLLIKAAEDKSRELPSSLKSLKVSSNEFSKYDLGEELLSGLFTGCTIAGPVSFIVIVLSARNVVLALYAVSTVTFIVTGVLGFCRTPLGWDLGVAEAVAGVIVIGYSVDYTLHLAHIYCEAAALGISNRGERAAYAVENMGSTVLAGAITTAGSSIFMTFCFLTFFIKMAILISLTITYALLFSSFFFMGLCFVAGPEGSFGNLPSCSNILAVSGSSADVKVVKKQGGPIH